MSSISYGSVVALTFLIGSTYGAASQSGEETVAYFMWGLQVDKMPDRYDPNSGLRATCAIPPVKPNPFPNPYSCPLPPEQPPKCKAAATRTNHGTTFSYACIGYSWPEDDKLYGGYLNLRMPVGPVHFANKQQNHAHILHVAVGETSCIYDISHEKTITTTTREKDYLEQIVAKETYHVDFTDFAPRLDLSYEGSDQKVSQLILAFNTEKARGKFHWEASRFGYLLEHPRYVEESAHENYPQEINPLEVRISIVDQPRVKAAVDYFFEKICRGKAF